MYLMSNTVIKILLTVFLLLWNGHLTLNAQHISTPINEGKWTAPPEVQARIDVDLVESSFPVGFSQVVAQDNHYIAYYDKNKRFCISYRKLKDQSFKKTKLDSKIGWDSHNYTAIVVDDQGYI